MTLRTVSFSLTGERKEHYCLLAKQVCRTAGTMDSRLTLATEEPVKKDSLRKYKILCVVSTVVDFSLTSLLADVRCMPLRSFLLVLLFRLKCWATVSSFVLYDCKAS